MPPCIPSTALEAAVINAARRFVQLQRTVRDLGGMPVGQSHPVVSTLNDLQGQIIANAAIVPAAVPEGSACSSSTRPIW
jgi:hypothetical protein